MKIGFTNGCFDLLHEGHLYLLAAAKSRCDYLVIAVDSDENVRRLKGEGRPFQTLEERMLRIRSIDYGRAYPIVIPFTGSPIPLICAIQPRYLFKGDDRPAHEIQGASILPQWGGELVLLPRIADISTTEIACAQGRIP